MSQDLNFQSVIAPFVGVLLRLVVATDKKKKTVLEIYKIIIFIYFQFFLCAVVILVFFIFVLFSVNVSVEDKYLVCSITLNEMWSLYLKREIIYFFILKILHF